MASKKLRSKLAEFMELLDERIEKKESEKRSNRNCNERIEDLLQTEICMLQIVRNEYYVRFAKYLSDE